MDEQLVLAALSETERDQALKRFRLLQPFLEGQAALSTVARDHKIPLRTAQRWVSRYRQYGLVGLARRRRRDRRQHRLAPLLQKLIEGLALQKTRPTAAAVHRQATETASQQGWKVPSYSSVYAIVRSLEPALVELAHHGTKAYQDSYDLLYRREAGHPNEIWQADHSPLDVWLLDEGGQPARPWLTVVEDDYSRAVAGYYLTFEHPSALNTSLALRQAIWRKADPH
jgi:putative transposase